MQISSQSFIEWQVIGFTQAAGDVILRPRPVRHLNNKRQMNMQISRG